MRTTEKNKLRDALEQKRREANESYRRSQAVNREATAEPLQDLADQATESYRKEFLYSLSAPFLRIMPGVDRSKS